MTLAIAIIVLIAVSGALMHLQVGLTTTRLTLSTFVWYTYLFFVFIPVAILAVTDDMPLETTVLGCCAFAPIGIPFGVMISNGLFRFSRAEVVEFYRAPILPPAPTDRSKFRLLLAAALAITALYFAEVGTAPLLYALKNTGEHSAMTTMRDDANNHLQSRFGYLYFVLRQFGWALIACASFGFYLQNRTLRSALLLVFVLVVGLVYAAAALVKSPAAVMFICLGAFYYLHRRGRIGARLAVLTAALALAVPIGILKLHSPERPLDSIFEGIWDRIFYWPPYLVFLYFDLTENKLGFLYGRSINKLAAVLSAVDPDYSYVPLSRLAYHYWNPESAIDGSAPAPFVGAAYADWGVPGTVLSCVILGFLAQSVQIWIYRQPKSMMLVAAHAVLFYSFWEVNRTALPTALLSYGGLLIPMFIAVYELGARRGAVKETLRAKFAH